MTRRLNLWLLKDGEPLPVDDVPQILRTGRLARELESRGHEIHWFSGRFDHGQKTFRTAPATSRVSASLTLHLLDGRGYRKNISPARILHQQQVARQFASRVRELSPPDLIVAAYPSPELCGAARAYARSRDVPLLVDVRDPWPESFARSVSGLKSSLARPLFWHYRNLLRRSLADARGIISMSEMMLSWSLGHAARKRREGDRVFYLGCESPGEEPAIEIPERFTAERPLTAIFYGMFGSSHNGEVVIDAARKLESEGAPIRVILAGDGDLKPGWEARARGLESVEFTGWVSKQEAERHLARADVGCITIRGDINKFWFGNKFFEYNSHGLALLNDTQGELSAIIEREELGVNLPEDDAESLARALRDYLESPRLLERHRLRSREIFRERFTATAIYREYANYLEDCLRDGEVEEDVRARVPGKNEAETWKSRA